MRSNGIVNAAHCHPRDSLWPKSTDCCRCAPASQRFSLTNLHGLPASLRSLSSPKILFDQSLWNKSETFVSLLKRSFAHSSKLDSQLRILKDFAERKGFEPSIRCRIHTFQACSFNHSDTSLNILMNPVFNGRAKIKVRRSGTEYFLGIGSSYFCHLL